MALSQSTLSSLLLDIAENPIETEVDARAAWAAKFTDYFYDATVAGTAVAGGSLSGAQSAMETALAGLSTSGYAATAIQAGIIAFWGVVVPAAATVWAGHVPPVVSATPAPSLSGIAAAVQAAFTTNINDPAVTRAIACDRLSAALHPLQLGGTATISTMPTPTVVPIL